MPEGDTVHKLARALREDLEGAVLDEVRVHGQRIEAMCGAPVDEVFALGKNLFVVVGRAALRTHLGMHGSWRRFDARRLPPRDYRTVVELTSGALALRCRDAKEAEVLDRCGGRYRRFVRALGPDLLAQDFDPEAIVLRAREHRGPETTLCDLLLDQTVAAGIGNVYKSEVLFLEGRSPRTALGDIDDDGLVALYVRARELLAKNLGPGPRRTRPATAPAAPRLWVYGRPDGPCARCGAPVRYERLGRHRRSTYWCASCQPLGSAAP